MVLDHWHAVADFTVELRDRTPDGVTVAMSGELDRATGAEAQRVITELLHTERPGYVAVDMSQVTFMGTDGIRLLLICRRAAEQVNCRFGISQSHARVHEVLAMVHLDDVLRLSPGAPSNA